MKPRFDEQASAIKERVLDSPIVCSDETSARVEGRNWWEWVARELPERCVEHASTCGLLFHRGRGLGKFDEQAHG